MIFFIRFFPPIVVLINDPWNPFRFSKLLFFALKEIAKWLKLIDSNFFKLMWSSIMGCQLRQKKSSNKKFFFFIIYLRWFNIHYKIRKCILMVVCLVINYDLYFLLDFSELEFRTVYFFIKKFKNVSSNSLGASQWNTVFLALFFYRNYLVLCSFAHISRFGLVVTGKRVW